ncbi:MULTISPECIES: alpha/beta hydrolase [Komagataeibacter]|uniref:Lysophospholipase n=3 Tax=Komagataeibacter TaxID=1434011 RepID=A0A857FTJ1_KOMXY|nr:MULTISPECIES: alpha/beta hydrolase [Komagataeibacter]QHC37488.1 lysophospholipase [Komagataeibacter xylinus]QHC37603.1 lysophospholipase [Komagataeibacter xylinus]
MSKYLHCTMIVVTACALLPIVAYASDHIAPGITANIVDPGINERVMNIPLNAGGSIRAVFGSPARPQATIIMFPGGIGDIGLGQDGRIRHGDNFVVRTRKAWNKRGYAVLIPDTVGHRNLRGQRSSARYAQLIEDIIAFVHRQDSGPVFLLGTSQGAIAAVNGAAHAASGDIAGVVLTESVSVMGVSGETVFSAHPEKVQAPVLVVANRDDRCNVAPPQDAKRIGAAMTGSREVTVLMVAGGTTRSEKNCGSLTPHGYFGIEAEVITRISAWLEATIRTASLK